MKPGKPPASGDGVDPDENARRQASYTRCRLPTDIPFATVTEMILAVAGKDPRRIVGTVPSWVLVKDEAKGEQEFHEVEGVLVRSYQTWTDFPLFQWHRWYDWNLFVYPAPGFEYLRSLANKPPKIDDKEYTTAAIRDFDGSDIHTMECEFDCGLFGSRFRPGVSEPRSFGPMFLADWAWPMTGQYVWAHGRWIYDCGHPAKIDPEDLAKKFIAHQRPDLVADFDAYLKKHRSEIVAGKFSTVLETYVRDHGIDVKKAADALHDDEEFLTRSELHPCLSVATARWEAFNFVENGDAFVPAIQFMFFTTALGGYTDAEQNIGLPRQDLEFIVDLPKFEAPAATFPIGHTPDFPHNTIVLRPRLLHHFNFQVFKDAIGKTWISEGCLPANTRNKPTSSDEEPTIEPLRPKDQSDPNALPEQVKITIPLSKVKQTDGFYGVIVSLGWHDADGTQSKRVKHVKVKVEKVQVGALMHDEDLLAGSTGEWQVRVGVNGRWMQKREENVKANGEITLGGQEFEVDLHLAEEDDVSIAAHGEETDRVHDTYKDRSDDRRVLRLPTAVIHVPIPFTPDIDIGGRDVLYFQDCVHGDNGLRRRIVSAIEDDQFTTLGVENDPLGRIDPLHAVEGSSANPMPVKELKPGSFTQVARLTKEVGKSAELAEKPVDPKKAGSFDYKLLYSVEIVEPKAT